MADPTVRARHVGYTVAGKPLVRRLADVRCLSDVPDVLAARHAGYTAAGKALAAWAWECCDAVCTDEEIDSNTCYVDIPCLPGDVGINRRVELRLTDVATCFSARNKRAILVYDGPSGGWVGSIALRGGTMDFVFSCLGGGFFRLSWSGCETGFVDAEMSCDDPLQVFFPQVTLPSCCDCPIPPSDPSTDTAPEVAFVVLGNCRRTVHARHVGYTAAGKPLVARARPCAWDASEEMGCGDMVCPVIAEVTADGDCACMAGTYPMSYTSAAQWVNDGAFQAACSAGAGSLGLSCVDLGDGTVRLDMTVVCGITGGGTASKIIPAGDLEDLDEEFEVTIVDGGDPVECCNGTITVRVIRP